MTITIPAIAMILDIILKATVLLLLSWGVSLLLRRRSAATRYMVQAFTLSALLTLPPSVVLMPAWPVSGLPSLSVGDVPGTTASPSTPLPAARDLGEARQQTVNAPVAESQDNQRRIMASAPPAIKSAPRTANFDSQRASAAPQVVPGGTIVETAHPVPNTTNGPPYFAKLLLLSWTAGAVFVLLRWRLNASRLSGLVRRAAVLTDSGWNTQVRALAAEFEIERHVALLVSDELEIPIATGIFFPSVVLSPNYAEWSSIRRAAILRHELAHIRRWDALTHCLANLASAIYWFHPLVWLTIRGMRADRERACDDQVLAAGTRASDYAHELLDIVSELRGPELAAALAMARRSQLEGRVLAVLDASLPRGPLSRQSVLAIAVLTLIVMLPLAALQPSSQSSTPAVNSSTMHKPSPASAPLPPQPQTASSDTEAPEAAEAPEAPSNSQPSEMPAAVAKAAAAPQPATTAPPSAPPAPPGPLDPGGINICGTNTKLHHMSMNSDNGSKSWTATWSGDDCSVDLRAQGEIKFNAEATEILSISAGGLFEVNYRQGDTLKQIKITPSGDSLQYIYKVNGQQQPLEGDSKAWFSQFLLTLEHSTGFSADARVPALLAKGGPTAVLDEINNLLGDYVRGVYFRKLLEQPNLPGPVVQRIIKQAGEQISSDYELARVLLTVSKQYELADESSRTEFLNAAGKLNSDYEHARVLIELLKRPNISRESVNLALKSSATINSDYEKSRILLSLMDQKTFEQSQLDFYLKMVDSIHSDYERSRDLLAPMQRYALRPDQVNRIMDATAAMESDYEKSRLLIGLAGKGKFDEGQMSNYLKVVDSMKSDYERSRSLLELMKNNSLSPVSVSKALQEVSREQSDNEKSRVIISLLQANRFDQEQINTYLAVVDSMQSDNERSRCLLSLMEHDKLSDASVVKVLVAISRMNSDYEKSRVLLAVAGHYALTGAARESYIKSAESISSEYDRNRALAAVVKRATL